MYGGNAYIYVPKADDMVLIEKSETYDNIMTDIKPYKAEFEPGTNTIELESSGAGGDAKIYMLLDNMENMRPKSDVFIY